MIVLFWVSLGVVALDQLSKWAVLVALTPGSHIPLLPVFDITLVFNRGSAFGFLSDAGGWQRPLLIILPLVVSLFLVVIIKRLKPNRRQEGIALALILGGAVGNLFDRIFRGEVIDFLLFYYQGWSFPVFNIADIAINIGAALLILDLVGWQVISNRNKHEK